MKATLLRHDKFLKVFKDRASAKSWLVTAMDSTQCTLFDELDLHNSKDLTEDSTSFNVFGDDGLMVFEVTEHEVL